MRSTWTAPWAVEATHVFRENLLRCYDEETRALVEQGINPIDFPGLRLSVTSEESKAINFDSRPKVIISAAGMCDAGRIRHHLKHNLWREECSVVFAGYQAAPTLGRALVDGADSVKLFGETIEVRAHIEVIAGLSGHADRLYVYLFLRKSRIWCLWCMEKDNTCSLFAEKLEKEEKIPASAPFSGSIYDLAAGRWLKQTEGVLREKEGAARRKADGVFAPPGCRRRTAAAGDSAQRRRSQQRSGPVCRPDPRPLRQMGQIKETHGKSTDLPRMGRPEATPTAPAATARYCSMWTGRACFMRRNCPPAMCAPPTTVWN